jgi:hypothetical protein
VVKRPVKPEIAGWCNSVMLVNQATGVDPRNRAVRRCATALARGAARLTRRMAQLGRACGTPRPICEAEPGVIGALETHGRRVHRGLVHYCPPDILRQLAPCAQRLDEIVGPTGSTGCLVGAAVVAAR